MVYLSCKFLNRCPHLLSFGHDKLSKQFYKFQGLMKRKMRRGKKQDLTKLMLVKFLSIASFAGYVVTIIGSFYKSVICPFILTSLFFPPSPSHHKTLSKIPTSHPLSKNNEYKQTPSTKKRRQRGERQSNTHTFFC